MTSFACKFRHGFLRSLRKSVVVLVLMLHVLAGAAHVACDLDVTNLSGSAIVSLADNDTGHAHTGLASHKQCHGCFSVALPDMTFASSAVHVVTGNVIHQDPERRGLPRGIEPPPPRFLT